ncbi:MAG: rhomboid family intramembrane serine protease [Oscillospiraceae bacterium]|nr:rhomboid family intramembrane serine protease [Oscillospiraceae bacterium]
MNAISNWIDRFCYKHPRFYIQHLMLIIIVGQIIVFLLDMFSSGGSGCSNLISFAPYYILHGQVWRIVTFVFVPINSSPILLIISLYFYFFIGRILEREWGVVKFTVFILLGAVLNIIIGFVLYVLFPSVSPAVTASMHYVFLSMFFAFATLFPNMQVLLFFIIPIKIKWLAWIDAAMFAYTIIASLVQRDFVGAIVPLIAILNYFIFFWPTIRDSFRRMKYRTSRQTIHFKHAANQARQNQQQRGYLHKCAVCGKTDTDYPDMEFRYCSKCNGYYCYCPEHINNHIHID